MTDQTRADAPKFLLRQGFGTPGDDILAMVEQLCGMNAQTPRGPIVGLRARLAGFELEVLDDLLRRYALVKANVFRGTVHLVTARQFLAWREALQPALERTVKQFCPRLWDHADRDALLDAGKCLLREEAGSDGLTRAELGRRLAPEFPKADAGELGFAVRLLAPVVQVADPTLWQPGQTRYILAESVLDGDFVPAEEGRADLLRAYLRAFGPAAAADASYFTGLTGLATPLKAVGDVVPGSPARTPSFDVARAPSRGIPDVVILPEYDNLYFAHKQGVLREARRRLIPNTATRMHGSVLQRGVPVAAWYPGDDGLPHLETWDGATSAVGKHFDTFRTWYSRQGTTSKETA